MPIDWLYRKAILVAAMGEIGELLVRERMNGKDTTALQAELKRLGLRLAEVQRKLEQ